MNQGVNSKHNKEEQNHSNILYTEIGPRSAGKMKDQFTSIITNSGVGEWGVYVQGYGGRMDYEVNVMQRIHR